MNELRVQDDVARIGVLESTGNEESFALSCPSTQPGAGRDRNWSSQSQYVLGVQKQQGTYSFDWGQSPSTPPADILEAMQADAAERVEERSRWIMRVSDLVAQIECWAKELGWATRRIDKTLEDSWIGKHRVPALLLQQDTCRIILEPIGRSAPKAQGVVDLYLMPAYDDIASLYFTRGRWNLDYLHEFHNGAKTGDTPSVSLDKKSFGKVLEEMRQHAAE